jgi:hypothetical protein
VLDKMVVMREELRQMWLNTSHSREQLAADLQAWCRRAEESGIAQLQQFSLRCVLHSLISAPPEAAFGRLPPAPSAARQSRFRDGTGNKKPRIAGLSLMES